MTVKILIVGFGNVGQGLAELLVEKERMLREKYKTDVQVVGIVTRHWGAIVDEHGLVLSRVLASVLAGKGFAHSGYDLQNQTTAELIENLDYDVLIELTVTDLNNGEPATQHIHLALERGRSVITTNKGPIALHLKELETLAKTHHAVLKYEGTVMSGTPVLNLIEHNLAGLEIRKIEGIVNGSSNYILTRMEEGLEYDDAVKEARELGYLEADASADLDGWDAVAKVMILAGVAFGVMLKVDEVQRRGIAGLTRREVEDALGQNKVWRQVVELERGEQEGCLRAAKAGLRLLGNGHPLAQIKGAGNGLVIYTDVMPLITVSGPGAGRRETGYAVLNDLLSIFTEQR